MEKLKQLTKDQLEDRYYNEFGLPAHHHNRELIIAALWYGKRIKYLTNEEINQINEE